MNTNTKNLSIYIVFLIFIALLAGIGCSKKAKIPEMVHVPERIITDFSDMYEHEIVSWVWIRRGFVFNNCRTITLEPVSDLSLIPQKNAVGRFQQGLHKIIDTRSHENGELDVIVYASVIDTKVYPGRVKKWFTDFDNFPFIEIEILLTEQSTGLPLLKIIHFSRDKKSLNNAVSKILSDLDLFFTTAI